MGPSLIRLETKTPLLFIATNVPKTLLPPIVITSTLVPSASEIASISSFGMPGGIIVTRSLLAQKTPE